MELSRFTDYSLRALIYVGLHGETLVTVADIADAYGISKNHVVKVIHKLAQLELIHTYRGRGGGLELARTPESIAVGEVVRATESMNLVECFDPANQQCRIFHVCELKRALREAHRAFLETLDEYTLADLLAPGRKLNRTLGLASDR